MYDITSMESFKNLKFWLKEVKDHADDNIIMALIGNKSDILIADPSKREVPKEQAIQFAKNNGLIFIDESSALADINIKNVIEILITSNLYDNIEIYEAQLKLAKDGKKDLKSLKLTYEEMKGTGVNNCCQ